MLRRWVGARADEALQGTPGPLSRPLDQLRSEVHRHAELAQYPAMQAMVLAETREAQAETKGNWSWEVAYSRRDRRWGDMVSFQVTFDLPWQQERRQAPQIKAKQLELQRLKGEAQKIPPKIRVFSFLMLMCFLFTYLAIIAYEIIKSLSGMF